MKTSLLAHVDSDAPLLKLRSYCHGDITIDTQSMKLQQQQASCGLLPVGIM